MIVNIEQLRKEYFDAWWEYFTLNAKYNHFVDLSDRPTKEAVDQAFRAAMQAEHEYYQAKGWKYEG